MKQIKTVICKVSQARDFDNAVNRLIASGWALTKREIINAQGEISESFTYPNIQVLYAELEKDIAPAFEEVTL